MLKFLRPALGPPLLQRRRPAPRPPPLCYLSAAGARITYRNFRHQLAWRQTYSYERMVSSARGRVMFPLIGRLRSGVWSSPEIQYDFDSGRSPGATVGTEAAETIENSNTFHTVACRHLEEREDSQITSPHHENLLPYLLTQNSSPPATEEAVRTLRWQRIAGKCCVSIGIPYHFEVCRMFRCRVAFKKVRYERRCGVPSPAGSGGVGRAAAGGGGRAAGCGGVGRAAASGTGGGGRAVW